MKEQIHTIPISDAFASGDECPFCYIERLLRLTLGAGASYMEPEVREVTTQYGFCRGHYKKMFDFSNALGNALIMQSYMAGLIEEMQYIRKEQRFPGKRGLLRKKLQDEDPLLTWAKQKQSSCFICMRLEESKERSYSTFFTLLKDEEFRHRVEVCKGFCMEHFMQLLEQAQAKLPDKYHDWFCATIPDLMLQNMERVKEDLDWFAAKFDYRNASADWKNSKDAVSRTMQKLAGIYPADQPYKQN